MKDSHKGLSALHGSDYFEVLQEQGHGVTKLQSDPNLVGCEEGTWQWIRKSGR
jgi:hypothetical protein